MNTDEHRQRVLAFFEMPDPQLMHGIHAAAYALSELRLLPDEVDSVSAEQLIACWKVVEKLRTTPFPGELRM